MTNSDWTGERLGDGPVVVSADWDDGRPMNRDLAVQVSVGPDYRPVRVPCDRLADFLTAHDGVLLVSRDVVEIAAPLHVRGDAPGSRAVAEAVAVRMKNGTWVDVGRLLQTVVDQHCGFAEKLDESAMLALDQLLGTKGLGVLTGVLEGLQRTTSAFGQRAVGRSHDHRAVAAVFAVLTRLASALEADAHADTRENADPVPLDDGEENGSQADAERSPTSAGRPTAINSSPLGNRIGVWAEVLHRHLDRAELAVDTGTVAGFRRVLDASWDAAWVKAERYGGLRACFAEANRAPLGERLSGWLAREARNLVDDDRVDFTPPPLGEPPSLEKWGLWAAANPAVAVCRELLRCHALDELLDGCQGGRLTGARDHPFTAYRRMATAERCSLFKAHPRHELWVVQPYTPRLHTQSAVLDARGNHGVIPRLPFLLRAPAAEREDGEVYARIAAELEWHCEGSRLHQQRLGGQDDEAAARFVRAFVGRHQQGDVEAGRWVATARGLLDTAAFGVDLDILRRVLNADYGVDHRPAELRRLRSTLSTHILPELAGYWENQRVWAAARRLGLPEGEVYVRLRDQARSVAEQFEAARCVAWEVRETHARQLMKDVVSGGEGRVVRVLERMARANQEANSAPIPDQLRSLMLTRTLTPGGRVAGPAYPAEVRRREYAMACEELTLGIAHELIADGFGVAAVTPEEILLEEPAGRVKAVHVRASAEAGAYRVLGRHAGPVEVIPVTGW